MTPFTANGKVIGTRACFSRPFAGETLASRLLNSHSRKRIVKKVDTFHPRTPTFRGRTASWRLPVVESDSREANHAHAAASAGSSRGGRDRNGHLSAGVGGQGGRRTGFATNDCRCRVDRRHQAHSGPARGGGQPSE